MSTDRLAIRKTYKLYLGGAFPRSESGRAYPIHTPDGQFLAHAAQASRKDARDAVAAARKALAGWSAATAYNRGQILYRIAEMLDGRRAQFLDEIRAGCGAGEADARREVDTAIDRWIWYAGWADKITTVFGAANPVAGPYFNFSVPEPTGVVAVLAPPRPALLALTSTIAPAIVSGNTVIAVASEPHPLPAITLSEVLATADLPPGVINILTGHLAELAPILAAHMDINAIDLTGAAGTLDIAELERAAADNIKRVLRPTTDDWHTDPDLTRIHAYLETKTIWHPIGI